MRHPLSPRARANAGAPLTGEQRALAAAEIERRAATEHAALNKFRSELFAAFDAPGLARFTAALENIVGDLQGTVTRVRATEATIMPDARGTGWQCPPVAEVQPALAGLHRYIANSMNGASHSPLQTAIVALVMTSCIHPFMDGNGRLSRVLFHAILAKHGMSRAVYVPLKSLYAVSDFGFEIRLRHTFLTGDWTGITVYFCHVLRLWHLRVATAEARKTK